MKKRLTIYLAWILVGTIGIGPVGSIYAVKQPSKTLPSQKKRWLLRFLSKDFRDTYNLYRKKQAEGAPLEELRKLDLRMLETTRKAHLSGLKAAWAALVVAIIAGYAAQIKYMEIDWDRPEDQDAASKLLMLPITAAMLPAVPLSIATAEKYSPDQDNITKLNVAYAKRAIAELLDPKSKQYLQLLGKIRIMETAGNTETIAALKSEAQKLYNEIERDKETFLEPVPTLLKSWIDNYNRQKINLILAQYKEEPAPSSPLYSLFMAAITKNKNAIKATLAQGDIHLFDESWVWPAIVDVYYFKTTQPAKNQVEQLKKDVDWQKWYEYWTAIEENALNLRLLGENKTIQPLTTFEREKLAADVKHQLFEMKIKKEAK